MELTDDVEVALAAENRRLRARIAELERRSPGPETQEWQQVTLKSIGDAVLATDTAGRITFLNPVAAVLTGWPEGEAVGRPVGDVFRIVDEHRRCEPEDIVARVLRDGCTLSLANGTALVRRDGREIPIEDSAAPIRDRAGNVSGVVLVFHDVSEKRQAQKALRESEQRVRLKLDSILSPAGDIGHLELGDVIDTAAIQSLMDDFYELARVPLAIIDTSGRVLVGVGWQDICTRFHRVNPETCKHCIESDTQLTAGVAPGEFKLYKCKNNMWDIATPLTIGGRHVGNLFSGQFFFENEPVDYDLFRSQAARYGFDEQEYLAALDTVPRLPRYAVEQAIAFLAKVGNLISLLSYSNIKLARSLSERDALTASLQESSRRLSRTQAMAHLGSWELDLIQDRLFWSDEVYRIFGLEPQEFGATYEAFLEAVHPEDRAAVNEAYSASLREGRDIYEIVHRVVRRGTGEVRWVHEKCEHFRGPAGEIVRSVGMVQDITERKRAEDQVRDAQKMESIGLLAGGIAHDFNNLLVGILGNASLMEDMLPPESPVRNALGCIIESGQQAAHLTRQMLAYAGKGRFILQPVSLAEIVKGTAPLIQSALPKKIALQLHLDSEMPRVESDPGQMQQIFLNLALNAGEAIGDAAGVISVQTGEVLATEDYIRQELNGWAVEPGRYAVLEVRDTGCGMDDATRHRIFDPFFTTKFTGRGLGLAAVAGIVRAHKGAIHLATAPGAGATFRVLLPATAAAPRRVSRAVQTDLRGRGTVLVVDDEKLVCRLVKHCLERHGYEVLTASGGPAAAEIVSLHGARIRLVILDQNMPGMSGQEVLPLLRRIRPDLKVVVSSGYSPSEALETFDGAQISGFIQKPYSVHELAAAVKEAIEGNVATPLGNA